MCSYSLWVQTGGIFCVCFLCLGFVLLGVHRFFWVIRLRPFPSLPFSLFKEAFMKTTMICFNCMSSKLMTHEEIKKQDRFAVRESDVTCVTHCNGCGYPTLHTNLL